MSWRPQLSPPPISHALESLRMTKNFDVFLSHNSKDKPAVRELAEALRARGLRVWLDEWELVPGQPWQEALEVIIGTAGASAVLVGKDGLGPWQDKEMKGCLFEFVERNLSVIPVLLPGAPEKPMLPIFLKGFTWVDLRGGLTEEGIDRLQWGITGKRPERSEPPPPLTLALERSFEIHAGKAFTEPLTGIRFLWIPGGRFPMGGNGYEESRPIHWVRISAFWLAETSVTNRQYEVFLERTGVGEPDLWHDPSFSSPDQPVVGVSWEDANAFCRWLTKAADRQVRLPSEAQWEFAARSTDGREYPWGNEPPDETRACFTAPQPASVGSFPAGRGPFGTLDQVGNVLEWCRDVWDGKTYSKRAKTGTDSIDPVEGEDRGGERVSRILRGDSGQIWQNIFLLRAATCRTYYPAWERKRDFGFRVATFPKP